MECSRCGSLRVFPSRVRGGLERIRSRLTDKQPYRCHTCNWRGWHAIIEPDPLPDVQPDDLRTGRRPSPLVNEDFDPLDPPS
jgi:hypothetical protein